MQIITNWTFGNFSITAKTDVDVTEPVSDTVKELLGMGLLQALQRVPSSNAEKHVVGSTWPKNKKGEPERPKDFKRNSIAYSEETAMTLAEGFGTEVSIGEGLKLKFVITDVTEHEGGGEVSRKMATEMAQQVLALPDGVGKTGQLMFLGVDGTDESALVEACHKFLAGLRKKKA